MEGLALKPGTWKMYRRSALVARGDQRWRGIQCWEGGYLMILECIVLGMFVGCVWMKQVSCLVVEMLDGYNSCSLLAHVHGRLELVVVRRTTEYHQTGDNYNNSTNNCRSFILKICRSSLTHDLLGWRYPCFPTSRWIVDSWAKVILDFARRQGAEQAWGKTCPLTKRPVVHFGTHVWMLECQWLIGMTGWYQWDRIWWCDAIFFVLTNMSNDSLQHAHKQILWHQSLIALNSFLALTITPTHCNYHHMAVTYLPQVEANLVASSVGDTMARDWGYWTGHFTGGMGVIFCAGPCRFERDLEVSSGGWLFLRSNSWE